MLEQITAAAGRFRSSAWFAGRFLSAALVCLTLDKILLLGFQIGMRAHGPPPPEMGVFANIDMGNDSLNCLLVWLCNCDPLAARWIVPGLRSMGRACPL